MRMCELLVGLPDVDVIGVENLEPGRLVVVIEPRQARPRCERCGTAAWVKDNREVDLVDLPAFDLDLGSASTVRERLVIASSMPITALRRPTQLEPPHHHHPH